MKAKPNWAAAIGPASLSGIVCAIGASAMIPVGRAACAPRAAGNLLLADAGRNPGGEPRCDCPHRAERRPPGAASSIGTRGSRHGRKPRGAALIVFRARLQRARPRLRLAAEGWDVRGTARDPEAAAALQSFGPQGCETYRFDREHPLPPAAFDGVTHVLVSIPPDEAGDLVLDTHARRHRRVAQSRLARLSVDDRGLWRPRRRLGR